MVSMTWTYNGHYGIDMIGYLPQEPVLDPSKTVMENVMDGLAHKFDLVKQFDAISEKVNHHSMCDVCDVPYSLLIQMLIWTN
jgi:ATPase subunit of ABC transporter with duplicated ATPase domains